MASVAGAVSVRAERLHHVPSLLPVLKCALLPPKLLPRCWAGARLLGQAAPGARRCERAETCAPSARAVTSPHHAMPCDTMPHAATTCHICHTRLTRHTKVRGFLARDKYSEVSQRRSAETLPRMGSEQATVSKTFLGAVKRTTFSVKGGNGLTAVQGANKTAPAPAPVFPDVGHVEAGR